MLRKLKQNQKILEVLRILYCLLVCLGTYSFFYLFYSPLSSMFNVHVLFLPFHLKYHNGNKPLALLCFHPFEHFLLIVVQ